MHAGRLAALLLLAAGALTILNNYLPGSENLNKLVLNGIGASSILFAALAWVAPWERWHPRATLVLVPVALGLIGVANRLGGVSAYSYAVYFVVLFTWIGISQPPRTSLAAAPLAAAAYVLPAALSPDQLPGGAISSVTVAIPVCVLVGETVARVVRRLETASAVAERRAELLAHLAGATRRLSELDPDQVLAGVVSSAVALGFEAAEICAFDPDAGTYRIRNAYGLPRIYLDGEYPIGSGVAGRVRERRSTVVVEDYAGFDDGITALRAEGYHSVVGAPVWCRGEVEAALIAGTRERRALSAEEVEAFELLASQAGRALENAQRFEDERRAVERLAELDRMKDDFISTGSHELRTPLAVIMGLGMTLDERWDEMDEGERRRLLGVINANAGRLSNIVETLLDFSRLEAGVRPERRPVALAELVNVILIRLGDLFSKHALHVEIPPRVVVDADPGLLERVLENLLVNAVRHTPPGTRVTISATLETPHVLIAVADDGPGIAAEDLQHIGRRFFRGGRPFTRASKGTGLGLALAREILTLHGSSLEVSSEPQRGARFAFRLPLVVKTAAERRGA